VTTRLSSDKFVIISAAALVLSLSAAGCKDKKKPWADAKAEHAPTFASVAAYAPLLDNPSGPLARRVAVLAVDRIMRAVKPARDAQVAKKTTLAEEKKEPRLALQHVLASIDIYCHRLPTVSKDDDEVIANCAKGVKDVDIELAVYSRQAEKEAPGLGIPATLAGWLTDDAKKSAEPLAKVAKESGVDDDKITKLWRDPNATLDALDGACREQMDKQRSERNARADAGAGSDPLVGGSVPPSGSSSSSAALSKAEADELDNLRFEAVRESVERCLTILQFNLADKVLGTCLDTDAPKCFNERTCKMVEPLKKSLDPPTAAALIAGNRRYDDLPKALEPRAKKLVNQCEGHFRSGGAVPF